MQTDDRITCKQCQNWQVNGYCQAAMKKRLIATSPRYMPDIDKPRRCEGFLPNPQETDQRTGLQHWTGFKDKRFWLTTLPFKPE